jgi:muramoyltetrapeptide carboxypeptidase
MLRAADLVAAPLLGGNLASLVSIIGTPFDFSWEGKIIFLEDINEPAYRVDRMLTQLFLAGKFKISPGCSSVIFPVSIRLMISCRSST